MKKIIKPLLKRMGAILIDFAIAALVIIGIWVWGYKIPHGGISVDSGSAEVAESGEDEEGIKTYDISGKGPGDSDTAGDLRTTNMVKSDESWREKFADKFTDEVVITENSYSSPNLCIELTKKEYDSGVLDTTLTGQNGKYGSGISYVIADIYVADIECFRTVFAQDMCGSGYEEPLRQMDKRLGAVFSMNGDTYSSNKHENSGTIIRNGVIYRNAPTDSETCVLYYDGTMEILQPSEVDVEKLVEKGAYQTWIFGPSLLTDEGKAVTEFDTERDYLQSSHPRTAIGYYEPGHYMAFVADGRKTDFARGMFMEEMSSLFEDMGLTLAYNFDGGAVTGMLLNGDFADHPVNKTKAISDGVYLREISE